MMCLRAPGHSSSCRGLTLVELMVVLSIVIVLVALAAPSFSAMIARERVKSINADIVTALQYARSEAIQRRANVSVNFRTQAGQMTCYSVYTQDSVGACDCRQLVNPCVLPGVGVAAGFLLKLVQVPTATGVTLSTDAPQQTITITPERGFSQTNAVDAINVTASSGGRLQTRVNQTQIRVCSPDGSIGGVPSCPPAQ